MVNTKRMIKYITKIGQKTGILNASINVQIKAIIMARVLPYLPKKIQGHWCGLVGCHRANGNQLVMSAQSFVSYQNLNSGSLRINGLNSSSDLVGNVGPSSSSSAEKLKTFIIFSFKLI
jgi:hypothetical protein